MVIVIFLFCLSKVQLHGFDARVSLVDSHLYVIYQIGLVNVHPAGIEVGTIYDRQIVFRIMLCLMYIVDSLGPIQGINPTFNCQGVTLVTISFLRITP